jgi:hypothetical protein
LAALIVGVGRRPVDDAGVETALVEARLVGAWVGRDVPHDAAVSTATSAATKPTGRPRAGGNGLRGGPELTWLR